MPLHNPQPQRDSPIIQHKTYDETLNCHAFRVLKREEKGRDEPPSTQNHTTFLLYYPFLHRAHSEVHSLLISLTSLMFHIPHAPPQNAVPVPPLFHTTAQSCKSPMDTPFYMAFSRCFNLVNVLVKKRKKKTIGALLFHRVKGIKTVRCGDIAAR
uniref:Uncharacterized protein n=1 Tax=Trypanosoma congolense (strain IL3000) TaxID=1068625 RepID=G0UP20_TRYCI|nr:hypothetical protein TCIL3000_6_3850 [Trypanosoma congolense IL3000]